MPEGELWSTLVTAIDPDHIKAMPAVLLSTIELLETELANARAALEELQPHAAPMFSRRDELALGAMTAYRQNLIGRAPDFFYGTSRLTSKELGLVPMVHEVLPDDEEPYEAVQRDTAKLQPISTVLHKPATLNDVLSNNLILDHIAPYLSTPALFAVASTSRNFRSLILGTPYVFRHLDLTQCRGAYIITELFENLENQATRNVQPSDATTADEFYAAPLRNIFAHLERLSLLQDVRTLVLDGVSVPAELIADIILSDRFNINILSIRGCRQLNERKLMQVLNYAVRPTRPKGTPRLKGLYYFTPIVESPGIVRSKYRDWWNSRCSSQGSSEGSVLGESPLSREEPTKSSCKEDPWFYPSGKIFKGSIDDGWAETVQKCEGIIAFDAVLCRGHRHNFEFHALSQTNAHSNQESRLLAPAIATVALGPRGCDGCHTAPEGPDIWGQSNEERFPLLAPPPLHSSAVTAARRPALNSHEQAVLIARCTECLTDRWCHRCNKWFCASCLPHPERVRSNLTPHQTAVRGPRGDDSNMGRPGVSKDCWECGPTCAPCKAKYQRTCSSCQGDYCIEHNEGCSPTLCAWCNTSTRHRVRELY
ncbi:uncharacterized protein BP01DRAFT_315464 [Aspergillus saccharolyticus JOP 1030-1]|uniref:Ubiquitin fusion degradation protein n=1 Tax=Aspergillus saccharolyticus JOP 1030-1 TaxID=1450539 RepID=A0A318ZK79_9EURO|nr:hypothetical protein BP01DRAFT_315464 [Aspergillus saccharolyticus JOP 1030-1]PYH47257.1 hypothetical protein BP01DRAFT_315464 [Aspergillus saccharolyticus JOP 1030-1]